MIAYNRLSHFYKLFNEYAMNNQKTAVVLDDETILLDGRTLKGKDEVGDALRSALESEPDFILVIQAPSTEHFKAIGTVIYASQRVGIPLENLRWQMAEGEVMTLEELRAR